MLIMSNKKLGVFMITMKKRLMGEFLGTYFLVFTAAGAGIVDELTGVIGHLGKSITSGFTVLALIYALGHISGAQLNPAVTIGFFINRDMDLKETISYILIQILGAILASATLLTIFGNVGNFGMTLPRESWQQGFVIEFILTFFLMLVIMGAAVHGRAIKSFAGIAIGSMVMVEIIFGGPISGASMNPARSLGPALISGNFEHLWIYLVATTLGAALASLVYRVIHE